MPQAIKGERCNGVKLPNVGLTYIVIMLLLTIPALATVEYGVEQLYPVVSPDGKEIAFVCSNLNTSYSVWRMNSDGSALRMVGKDDAVDNPIPRWRTDGKLTVVNDESVYLRPGAIRATSPDKSKVAYVTDALYIDCRNKAEPKRIPVDGIITGFDWFPDSQRLVVASRWDRRNHDGDSVCYGDLYVIDADGRVIGPVTNFAPWLFRRTTEDLDFGVLSASQVLSGTLAMIGLVVAFVIWRRRYLGR